MEKDAILAYIRAHETEERRRRRMYDYYRGKHDILKRKFDDPTKPNNRLCCGFPAMISNAYTGYVFGEPISYNSENAELLESVQDAARYNDEQAENSMLGMDLSICGVAVEIHYVDEDSMMRFKRVDPITCIDVRDGSIEENLTALIRYYDLTDVVSNRVTRHVDVYEKEATTHYEQDGGDLIEKASYENFFGDVPAVVYRNNAERMGDFEGVITLIDAYDLMQSESLNDQEYFSDAFLMLKNMLGTRDEDVANMKRNRVLLMPEDSDAAFLTKPQNDAVVENVKKRLNEDIHRFSGCPNMTDESFAGNASGVAIRYKLLQYENISSVKEREFKRGLQRRVELQCNLWAINGRGNFDWREIQISFRRALPQNVLEIAQTLSTLGSIISDETKRAQLPMDIDEDTEKNRIAEQRKANMSLYQMPGDYEELMNDGGN